MNAQENPTLPQPTTPYEAALNRQLLAWMKNTAIIVNRLKIPVGGVYINLTGTDPAVERGYGTWTQFGQGRVLVGVDTSDPDFDTVLETGGSKTASF